MNKLLQFWGMVMVASTVLSLAYAGMYMKKVCEEIEAGSNEYSEMEVNECVHMKMEARCGKVHCSNHLSCDYGHKMDLNGCETCECAMKPDEADMYQGDIILNDRTMDFISQNMGGGVRQRAAGVGLRIWNVYPEGDNFIVPYSISSELLAENDAKDAIYEAIRQFSEHTCIELREAIDEQYQIEFYAGSGCSSIVGRTSGVQQISLSRGCWRVGTIIHEIMHALSFWHEHTRPDRDSYVRIHPENIRSGTERNFEKLSENSVNYFGSTYDYGSVMHYSSFSFSSNGEATITRISDPNNYIRGQRDGFSESDIEEINALYQCKSTVTTSPQTTTTQPTTTTRPTTTSTRPTTTTRRTTTTRPTTTTRRTTTTRPTTTTRRTTTTRPITQPTTAVCADRNQNCARWARIGYCSGRYVTYMTRNCCASCNMSPPPTTTKRTTTTTTTTTTTPANCQDSFSNCDQFQRYCSHKGGSGNQITKLCPKTCGAC